MNVDNISKSQQFCFKLEFNLFFYFFLKGGMANNDKYASNVSAYNKNVWNFGEIIHSFNSIMQMTSIKCVVWL